MRMAPSGGKGRSTQPLAFVTQLAGCPGLMVERGFTALETPAASVSSAVNPLSTINPGQPASWVTNANGWVDLPFPPEGAIRMRYWYTMGPDDAGRVHDVTLQACGSFPGFGPTTLACSAGMTGNYLYTEVFHGNGTSDVVELPDF